MVEHILSYTLKSSWLLIHLVVPNQNHIVPTRSLSAMGRQLAQLYFVEPLASSPFRVLLHYTEDPKASRTLLKRSYPHFVTVFFYPTSRLLCGSWSDSICMISGRFHRNSSGMLSSPACLRSLIFFRYDWSQNGNKASWCRFATLFDDIYVFRWNRMCLDRLTISYSPTIGICGAQIAKVLRVFGRAIVSLDLREAVDVRKKLDCRILDIRLGS